MTSAQTAILAVSVIAAAALAAAVGEAQEPAATLANATVKATLGLRFEPAEVEIPAGGSVEWRNTAFFSHSVTDDPSLAKDPADAQLPPGAQPFDSGKIGGGKTWRHTFTVPGRYVYFCRPHEGHHMTGVVVVK